VYPVALDHIEVVVKTHTDIWEFDLGGALPAIAEAEFILIKRCTKGPHTSEKEEGLINLFDFFFIVILFKTLHVIILFFISDDLFAKFINNCDESVDLSKLTNWGNMSLVLEIIEE
jgi:hypothetical protein